MIQKREGRLKARLPKRARKVARTLFKSRRLVR